MATSGSVLAHPAHHPDRGRHVGEHRQHDRAGEPRPVRRAEGIDALVDVRQLRQQHVERAGQGGDRHDGLRLHAHEPFERHRLATGRRGDLLACGPQHALRRGAPGTRRQGEGLQVGHGGGEVVGVEDARRGRDDGVGAHCCRERRDQLGPIDRLITTAAGRRGRAEVDDHDAALAVGARGDEDVGAAQRAVGEPGPVQRGDLRPDLVEQLVVELVGPEVGDAAAADVVGDEHHRGVRQRDHGIHRRAGHAATRREQEEQRLVLDLVAHGRRGGTRCPGHRAARATGRSGRADRHRACRSRRP